jgi:Asp/Glu/hydantoin racemase
MGTISILDYKGEVQSRPDWDGQRRLKFMFIRTSVHDYTTVYSHELIDDMERIGLLNDIDWDYDPGPIGPLVETREDLLQVGWGVLQRVRAASESGRYDAIIIQGGLDPVLYQAREVSNIPVLGCVNSAMHIASLLGHHFSIIDTLECMAILFRENSRLYQLDQKLASVRSIEYPVREILRKERLPELLDALDAQAMAAIEKDGADTLILGCTALNWLVPHLRYRLQERDLGVPVVETIYAAVSLAKGLVTMRQRHSRLAYPSNKPKKRAIPR